MCREADDNKITFCVGCEYYKCRHYAYSVDHKCIAPLPIIIEDFITGRIKVRMCHDINKGDCPHYKDRIPWYRKLFK
jgi:hypothetical protein